MLHRFADPERGNDGHDPARLRARLAALRRAGRELVSVEEIVRRGREDDFRGSAPVAFTVDDGYADFSTVGLPAFAEFDCPVTVFLVSGVLDGEGWYWWDRITAAFEQTTLRKVEVPVAGRLLRLSWEHLAERVRAEEMLMEALKPVSDEERHRVLQFLPSALGAHLAERPTAKYAPMSWEEVRRCGMRGASFGAHTVTHPILSRVGDKAAHDEITTSWNRLRQETTAITDVFCYPNGGPGDFGQRETKILAGLGFGSAVTTIPGHVTSATCTASSDSVYRIPRFPYREVPESFAQIVTGVERAKMAIRRLKPG